MKTSRWRRRRLATLSLLLLFFRGSPNPQALRENPRPRIPACGSPTLQDRPSNDLRRHNWPLRRPHCPFRPHGRTLSTGKHQNRRLRRPSRAHRRRHLHGPRRLSRRQKRAVRPSLPLIQTQTQRVISFPIFIPAPILILASPLNPNV